MSEFDVTPEWDKSKGPKPAEDDLTERLEATIESLKPTIEPPDDDGEEIPPEPEPRRNPGLGPNEDACFPVDEFGMPLALNEIPDQERPFFWHDGLYRGFPVALVGVQASEHAHLFDGTRWEGRNRSFYVASPQGVIGLVPFPNSTVVWPHEAGWVQDLHFARQEREARFKKELQKKLKEGKVK